MTPDVSGPGQVSRSESRQTAGVITALLGVELFLFVWFIVFHLTADRFESSRGLLTILCLLSSGVAILTLTQVERAAERRGVGMVLKVPGWLCLIYLALCAVAILGSRTFGSRWFEYRTEVLFVVACLGLLVGAGGIIAGRPAAPSGDDTTDSTDTADSADATDVADPPDATDAANPADRGTSRTDAPTTVPAVAALTTVTAAPEVTRSAGKPDPDPDRAFTLALSGGGIRATSFGLGAYQALARHPTFLREREPRLVAVSGGSYIAAAIGLVRAQRLDDAGGSERRKTPLEWRAAYAADSPELKRLRRHTRDLVEPGSALLSGGLTLVGGVVLNLLVIAAGLLGAAVVLAWLYRTSGLAEWSAITVDDDPLWRSARAWAVGGPLLLLLVAWLALSFRVMALTQQRDNSDVRADQASDPGVDPDHDLDDRDAQAHPRESGREAPVRRDRLTSARTARSRAFLLLAVWLVVFGAIPATLQGLNRSSLHNEPSAFLAGLASGLGFATEDQCRTAAEEDLEKKREDAIQQARLSPGAAVSTTGGACGRTWMITVKEPPPENTVEPSIEDVVAAGGAKPGLSAFIAQVSAVLALLTTLGFSFSRAASTQGGPTDRFARVRRLLVNWVPLTAGTFLVVWLLLRWTFGLTMHPTLLVDSWWLMLVPVAGLGVATFFDANATSLHSHYRERLHNAFAVARRDDRSADHLPVDEAHGFSELDGVQLHVVTTANVRNYDEAPTRRGGLPFVFGPRGPMFATAGCAYTQEAKAYEQLAGPGRVSVMAAVAASGAAVSPLAGRYAATIAPFRVLLTVFNVRVGQWVLNPRWAHGTRKKRTLATILRDWPYTPWLIARPGAAQVFSEAFGQSSSEDRWLYLSDGGHLDNTGLIEAIRLHRGACGRYAGRVLVIDASNDVTGSWAAVGDAMSVVRADLGIDFECVLDDQSAIEPEKPTWRTLLKIGRPAAEPADRIGCLRLFRGAGDNHGLEVMIVKAVRPADLTDLPQSLRSFAAVRPEFPRAPTVRQDFGDLEFEAYRQLGELYTDRALGAWAQETRPR